MEIAKEKGELEIIGHPYGIAEVLRWFYQKDQGNYFFIREDGYLCRWITQENRYKFEPIQFNLSKPLSEQEDVMKQIYELALTLKN